MYESSSGSLEDGESEIECAIREVIEETGITITEEVLTRPPIRICNSVTYFYLEMNECSIKIEKNDQNDATGIAWIKPECLKKSIESGNITLTSHFRILARFLGF